MLQYYNDKCYEIGSAVDGLDDFWDLEICFL